MKKRQRYLFVSRAHIYTLLARGKLAEVLPRSPSGQLNIDASSVEAYRTEKKAAAEECLDLQTEESDPPKL